MSEIILIPHVYHVPIVIGDTDRHYTFYIYRLTHTSKVPTGKSDYAKACERLGLQTKEFPWYITTDFTKCGDGLDTHYKITNTYQGFEAPELALEALTNYLNKG